MTIRYWHYKSLVNMKNNGILKVIPSLIITVILGSNTIFAQDIPDWLEDSALQYQASKYSNEATEYLNNGEYQQAKELFNKYIEIYPYNGRIYIERALTKELLRDDLGAIEDYTLAIHMEPRNKYNQGSLGYDLVVLKDVDAYYKRGMAKARLEKFENALRDFNKALDLDSNHEESYFVRGLVRLELGDIDGCNDIQAFRELTEYDLTHLNQFIQDNCNFDY